MSITKFLDPKNDVAFKKIFGTEKNKDILIHFLNDVITFPGNSVICDVSFLKTELDPMIAAHKASIVDVLCVDEKGVTYIVEMQVTKQKGFEKRAQYYAAKAYTSQAKRGGKYCNLKEVIFLAIADFIMFPQKSGYKSDHVILDRETLENDLKDFSFTFLELPKFQKEIHDLSSRLEKWLYFFKYAEDTEEKEIQEIAGSDSVIEQAYEELNRFSWDDQDLRNYEAVEKRERDYDASMEQKFDEGRAEGQASIIKKMHERGLSLQQIQAATGLTEIEIKEILL